MASSNESQFFITLASAPQCDGKHVAVGRVVEGLNILSRIGEAAVACLSCWSYETVVPARARPGTSVWLIR